MNFYLQEALEPLMRLLLKLQKPESTVADSFIWVESTIELLEECKNRYDMKVYFIQLKTQEY
jgi:hypothetical protein